ncbi:S-layer homology domain-containing protein [Chamaesiphon sp.]|uniref:S-layer homology domain-containing protein n=1 Tax=Chamaesiphon sp. TaxID=2814140 RepID=UPI0035946701
MSKVKVTILHSQLRSVVGVAMLVIGLMTGAIAPYLATAQAPAPTLPNTTANTSFPDTQNHWAQPFIQALAKRNIVTGYPDNTFRPAQTVDRDEFAAILRQAFDKTPVRQIPSGSTYTDVPKGYWASQAIEEAYQMGFMSGYPGGVFRPKQPITKVQVLASLARNLELPATNVAIITPVPQQPATTVTTTPAAQQPATTVTTTPAAQQPATTATTTPVTQQPANMRAKKPMMFPFAIVTLMQPFMTTPARAIAAVNPAPTSTQPAPNAAVNPAPTGTQPAPSAAAVNPAPTSIQPAPSVNVPQRPLLVTSKYYRDAAQIPKYAVDAVAKTTAAGIVVNYPDLRVLNPNQAATRGEVSALIHQALVSQGKISPLPANQATKYIVGR